MGLISDIQKLLGMAHTHVDNEDATWVKEFEDVEAHIDISPPGGEAITAVTSYNQGFTIKDISEYDEETGVFLGKIIITYGASYIAADPEADPPVSESYNEYAGYVYVNALKKSIESEKFDITASKSVVIYSEITDTTPFISPITLAIIDDMESDLPIKHVAVWLGDVTFHAQVGTFGNEDFVAARINVSQVWKDGSSMYLPAFRDGNLTT